MCSPSVSSFCVELMGVVGPPPYILLKTLIWDIMVIHRNA